MPTASLVDETVLVDTPLRTSACTLWENVGGEAVEGLVFTSSGREVLVPADLTDLIVRMLEHTAAGGAFTIKAMPEEVTTTVAADLLGVSRPTLMKLIHSGELKGRKVRSHTRLLTVDVLELRAQRAEDRRRAFDELRTLSDHLGEE